MKYCENCKALNLNEQIFCRKCNHQFEDFDWDAVEHENIYSDSLNDQYRETERDLHKNHFNVSLKKDSIKFIIWTIICIYGMYYGINNSWICYYISLLTYILLILYKYYKIFYKIFDVKLEEKIGNKVFYNYRLEAKDLVMGGIFGILFFSPWSSIWGFDSLALWCTFLPSTLTYILFGLDFFIRPDVFNRYNDYYYVITVYSLILLPAFSVFGILSWSLFKSFNNISLNISLTIICIVILFTLLFLDKINKYTKYDIRGPGSWFIYYAIIAPFIPVIISVLIFVIDILF